MARARHRLTVLLITLAAAAAGLIAISPPGLAAAAWTLPPYTEPAGSFGGGLSDVSCLSPTWCMAISGAGYAQWDGTSWTLTPTTTQVDRASDLRSISCTSTSWCVAVGPNFDGSGVLIESWDGTAWTPMSAPAPQSHDDYLFGVSCASAQFCVAVGWRSTAAAVLPFVETWSGSAWTLGSLPLDASGQDIAVSVSCTSPQFCMAVGDGSANQTSTTALVYLWNGSAWSRPALPAATALTAVDCLSQTACNAVGQQGGSLVGASWNGSAWSGNTAVTPVGSFVNWSDLSCDSATSCIGVGVRGPLASTQTVIEHYNGTSWTLVSSPTTQYNSSFGGVSCATAAACVAVGDSGGTMPVIETNYQPGGAKVSKTAAATTSVTVIGPATVVATMKVTKTDGGGTVSFGTVEGDLPQVPACLAVPLSKLGTAYQASCTVSLTADPAGGTAYYGIEAAYTGSGSYLPSSSVPVESVAVLSPNGGFSQNLGTKPAFTYFSVRLETPVRNPKCTLGQGQLPAGLILSTTCTLAGTPTAPGPDSFKVILSGVTGSPSRNVTEVNTVQVAISPLTITSTTTWNHNVHQTFSTTLKATGGKGTLTWSVVSGSLPPGVRLSAGGTLSGTPTVAGSYLFTIGVHDSRTPSPQTTTADAVLNVHSG